MRPRRSPRANAISDAAAKAQLTQLLYTCTPQRLATLTVDGLAGMYRIDRKEIECEMIVARQKRAGELI